MSRSSDLVESLTSPCGRYRADILYDRDPPNPRLEWDNVCTMLCWHRRYNLGDPSPDYDRKAAGRSRYWEWSESYKNRDYLTLGHALDDDLSRSYSTLGPGLVLPLYLYDHSGITISTGKFSCPWDSGQVGWIHCSWEKANHELVSRPFKHPSRSRILRKKMLACMEAEVRTYDDYLTGQVFCYEIVDMQLSNPDDPILEDACSGYFGLDDLRTEIQTTLRRLSNPNAKDQS